MTDKAIDWIALEVFDPQYGVRTVERVLRQYLLNDLLKKILAGNIDKDKTIVVDLEKQELVFMH